MNKLPKDYTLLVVEDELPLQAAIRLKLENHGLNVVTARTVAQASEYLHEINPIDAIWLDHYLIGAGSGLDFVAQVRTIPAYAHIPIFVVSNSIDQEKITSYLQLGVSHYYTKTECRLIDIVTNIREYLDQNTADKA